MPDPTYEAARIEADPDWALAFLLSEVLNDNAPLGWSKYLPVAKAVREKFRLTSKGGQFETEMQRAAAK